MGGKLTNGLDKIAKFTGLTRSDMDDILVQVRANHAKLDGCKRHRFDGGKKVALGMKCVCLDCGGTMSLTDAGWYVKGYEAAGGEADDIWPGYHARSAR